MIKKCRSPTSNIKLPQFVTFAATAKNVSSRLFLRQKTAGIAKGSLLFGPFAEIPAKKLAVTLSIRRRWRELRNYPLFRRKSLL
jgi:hypothetical protein